MRDPIHQAMSHYQYKMDLGQISDTEWNVVSQKKVFEYRMENLEDSSVSAVG